MEQASAGPTPWDHEQYWNFRNQFRRTTRRNLEKQGLEFSLSSGYRVKPAWEEDPKKPKTRKIKLYNGKTVMVPDDDYQDFIGFRREQGKGEEPEKEISEYIEKAWLGKKIEVDGVGHIYDIVYSPTFQMMWVAFEGGAQVVFFRVPKEVFSTLKHLAESKETRLDDKNVERHVLGIEFWNIVRIRGQRTGSKYRYVYTDENSYESIGTATSRAMEQAEKDIAEKTKEKSYETKDERSKIYGATSAQAGEEAAQRKLDQAYKDVMSKIRLKFKGSKSGRKAIAEAEAIDNYKDLAKWAKTKGII